MQPQVDALLVPKAIISKLVALALHVKWQIVILVQ
jgi:hypothetical protein